jgi:hypothetical protein
LERVSEPRFGTVRVFCYEFVGLIRALRDGSSLPQPKTRSEMPILLRVALGGDIHATRVGGFVPFPARNVCFEGPLPYDFPGIIRSSLFQAALPNPHVQPASQGTLGYARAFLGHEEVAERGVRLIALASAGGNERLPLPKVATQGPPEPRSHRHQPLLERFSKQLSHRLAEPQTSGV